MLTLSLELSSERAGIALLREETVLAETAWDQRAAGGAGLFARLPALLGEAGVGAEAIEWIVCGRGPGAYAALRVALTAAHGLALPGGVEVYALSSGEALALAESRSVADGEQEVVVVGDARRETVWRGRFACRPGVVLPDHTWDLLPVSSFASAVSRGARIVTPQWGALCRRLPAEAFDTGRWVREDRFPGAVDLAAAARARRAAGIPSEPATPLYLHPAVHPRHAAQT